MTKPLLIVSDAEGDLHLVVKNMGLERLTEVCAVVIAHALEAGVDPQKVVEIAENTNFKPGKQVLPPIVLSANGE